MRKGLGNNLACKCLEYWNADWSGITPHSMFYGMEHERMMTSSLNTSCQ